MHVSSLHHNGEGAIIEGLSHVYLHLSVEPVVQQQVVSHSDPVRLHGVPLPIVVITYVTCRWVAEGGQTGGQTSVVSRCGNSRTNQSDPPTGLASRIFHTST